MYRRWWGDVPSRLGPATCKQYRRELFAALADIGKHPSAMTAHDVSEHLGTMRVQHASLRRAALSDFFQFLERRGLRADNPMAETKKVKVGRQRVRRAWTQEELHRVVFAAIWMGEGGVRGTGFHLAYTILAQYGMCLRPGEIVGLTKSNVHLNGTSSCAFITQTKTGNDRIVPVVGVAREALEKLVELSPETSNRLVHIGTERYWEKVRAACQLAGLAPEKSRPYALRHTGATHMAERGVKPLIIAQILGHSDLRYVTTYAQASDDLLREALATLG